jgi:putative N6-adenine-specific DNA methylase
VYLYQKTNRYFAQMADDIKDIARDEILALGASETSPAFRGIYFTATAETVYAINLQSRLLNRVLAPLLTFNCHSDRYLYKTACEICWQDFLDVSQSFAVFASVSNSNIKHSKFAALRLKDAIVDTFRSTTGKRPAVDTRNPDLWLNLYIENNEATISVDTSGGSLHRRGYRRSAVQAPMIETLAAAIINYADWHGNIPLYDPFCGSGTVLCEAYMHACRMPAAGLRHKFGFMQLPDYDEALWNQVRKTCFGKMIRPGPGVIAGSDVSPEAIHLAKRNCAVLDQEQVITIAQRDVFDIPNLTESVLICNPPYGIRMRSNTDLSDFYRKLGDFLKQRCNGSTAYIYFGDRQYIKHIGLRPSWKKPLANGGLDGRLAKYELY